MRCSGKNAPSLAKKITHRDNFTPRYATLSPLYDIKNSLIDEALIIYFKAPKSFTGEDIVEFQCHGGIVVASLVLQTLIDYGARLANPGEFSKRAFLNGKIDLTKAEAIAKLIESKSEDSIKLLARQMRGELKDFIGKIRNDLVEILAFVEVNIDYAEEDLPQNIFDMIKQKLGSITKELHVSFESSKRREGLLHGFHIAIVGKPNVGKSSLLNALLNDERAIISDIAGTTRDVIEEELKLGTHLVKIIDTAGIRDTNDKIEKIGVTKAKKTIDNANIIIAIFDGSREKDSEDKKIEKILKEFGKDKKIFTIVNKSDLPQKYNPMPINSLHVSCKNSVELIIENLISYLDSQSLEDGVMLTSQRQLNSVLNALISIKNANSLLDEGSLELFAFEIKESLMQISSITKIYNNDEMLDSMFNNFCLGK